MTPKEKAEQLIDSFRNEILSFLGDNTKQRNAVKCALIAVREIQNINSVDKDYKLCNYWIDVERELLIIYK
jgi:hypothetical protein